jgi:hypothetical protein
VLQDPQLQLAQLARGLEAQLLAKAAAKLRVQVERLRLAAAAVEGEHRERVQPLAQRLLAHQAQQLRQHLIVAAELELGLEPFLLAGEPELLQPFRLAARELLVGELAVGAAAPERKPAPQQRVCQRRIRLAKGVASFAEQPLEPRRVEHALVHREPVAAAPSFDPCRRWEQFAQLRHVDLKQLARGRWGLFVPERLQQPIRRTSLAGASGHRSKQPPRHRRKRHRAGLAHQLERSQHPDLDRRGRLPTHSRAATADRQHAGLYRI